MKQLRTFFLEKKVKKILDVGTGTGDFISVLTDVFPKAEIAGIDPAIDSLETAKQNYPEVIFYEMTAENLDFADSTFDVVSISMALHHLPNVQRSLAEMQRIVKHGGWIIVAELFSDNLNPAQEVHKMYHHFKSKTDRIKGISHNKTFQKDEIIRILARAGIKIELHFEVKFEKNLLENPTELDNRVQKMEEALESIKDYAEYEMLKPKIEKFREQALNHGFQPATRVLVVGKCQKKLKKN